MAKRENIHNNNNPHHQSSSSMRRHTILQRPSELFSAEALQHVVRPMKRKTMQPQRHEVEKERDITKKKDVVGDQMTKLLNAHPDFHFDAVRLARAARLETQQNQEGFTWSPLFSRRNWEWFQRLSQRIRNTRPSLTLLLSIVGFCYEITPSRQQLFTTLVSSLLLFISILVAGLSMVLYTSHIALVWSCREACLLAVQLALLLFDWNELEKNCPSLIQSIGSQFMGLCKWLDRHLFLEKRYAGREWNKDDFDFANTRTAQSRHTELWTLPPPCIQDAGPKLCLDPRYMSREEWSPSTSKHVVAINF